ncbi:Nif3-like dinuclear metal center hexameric protein [Lutispora saccharofermentans]|uniref:GTP cyclohydrolase 1 type 2 homolog n=1 Tax=Lutispora saccharofermentans TaxID=3024236 RepID=A0ABT1NFB7_9FIRM|nr:Nif3-like dinuclear metal center hexameric protein [Lutispora saccharofermentans]MCQ1529952.1 Nif3-like dinuclear metal center hexameric protein [Lutispora saccharofermentans]
MKSADLYDRLERDFISENMRDNWAKYMGELEEYLSPNFKERSMGLVCDFTNEINKVYSAVFPTKEILQSIIDDGATNAMLFLHHPSIWDSRRAKLFYQMDKELLAKLRENRVSIYNLHVPLDNFSEYSTSKTLADVLDIEIEKPFKEYCGALSGVIGKTNCKTVEELHDKFSKVLGHDTSLYLYGDIAIKDGRIAIVAGGGNNIDTVSEMVENKVDVLITGISANNEDCSEVHELERKSRINVLGGTHYSTEKFACQKMCTYFEKLGLVSAFIEGEPVYEDM